MTLNTSAVMSVMSDVLCALGPPSTYPGIASSSSRSKPFADKVSAAGKEPHRGVPHGRL